MLTPDTEQAGSFDVRVSKDRGTSTLFVTGRLDVYTTGGLWREALQVLQQSKPIRVVIDASGVTYCDGAGVALLLRLQDQQRSAGGDFTIVALRNEFQRLLDLYGKIPTEGLGQDRQERLSFVEQVGHASLVVWRDLRALVAFTGQLTVTLLRAAAHPHQVRWRDMWHIAELAGVNALPLVALIGFLLGLIMAFQSAIPMRQFGADIFVANLIGLSMLRELGPLVTAILLAGRSGSAFAAELGTMKFREEIDALSTMGLDSVRFLVVPRLLAAVTMTPLLTIFANLFGLIGGAVVMVSLGYPLVTYGNQLLSAVHIRDLVSGLSKSLVFGMVVAGVGCLRGLQTTTGASAVGESTTRAVVSGIILIAIVDGVFAVVFYCLGV
jgi:phospholipid/cholesterol/gamma-HCH transport system permease protein